MRTIELSGRVLRMTAEISGVQVVKLVRCRSYSA